MVHWDPHSLFWPNDGATRWANFSGAATHLSGSHGPPNLKVQFLTHSRPVKGYPAFTVPWDTLDDLLWNFEYLTSRLFGRPLTANFSNFLTLSFSPFSRGGGGLTQNLTFTTES